jgi:hypothetical protein
VLFQPAAAADPRAVETPAWFDWLEMHAAFIFIDPLGTFTAYKSAAYSNDSIWEASRTHEDQHFRVRLGFSPSLTLARLQAAAHVLSDQRATGEPTDAVPADPAVGYLSPGTTARLSLPSVLLRTKLFRPRPASDIILRPASRRA